MNDPSNPTSATATPLATHEPPPANGAAPPDAPAVNPATDKLLPFRALFGMPVAVQFAPQTPYLQISAYTENGIPKTVRVPGTDRVIGLPGVVAPAEPTHVAIGVIRASECGTWLVIEERLKVERTAESLGGQAFMDVYVRPEMVTHISFVRAVELLRGRRDDS